MNETPKITCPVCQRPDRTLTITGKIRHHNDPRRKEPHLPFGTPCAASGKRPEELA